MKKTIGEIVRKSEDDYLRGNTTISKYVPFSMNETINTIEAYLNSRHISGEFDSQGREKPFFNIVVAAANIWFRATDIDRADIKIRASAAGRVLDSFLATVILRQWMREARFGDYLNDWGRTLARYGSAVTKVVETEGKLDIFVVPWNRLICDPIDFESNPKIEVLEFTEGQLYDRVRTMNYDEAQVNALCDALSARTTLSRQKKDNKADYIKLYELHGLLPKSNLTGKDTDDDTYVQQMHVISFVGVKNGRKTEYQDFTLYAGEEAKDPYRIAHLIREDGRTLAIGAVEHLFQAQWMVNHSKKKLKDTLDLASTLLFQTADAAFVGRNTLTDVQNGDVLVHSLNAPLSQVNSAKPDAQQWETVAASWKAAGNEAVGVSEAMLGVAPKSGEAWRQTEAVLQESYSLFELMTENKGLYLEDLLREFVIPFIRRTKLNHSDEIAAILEDNEITQIDARYIKAKAVKQAGRKAVVEKLLKGEVPDQQEYEQELQKAQADAKAGLEGLGSQRFFKPSEISDKTWEEQLKDLEWELDIDITGEEFDSKDALTTLNTALQLVVQPGFDQNPKAQAIVGRILELTGAMSPVEYAALPDATPQPAPAQEPPQQTAAPAGALEAS